MEKDRIPEDTWVEIEQQVLEPGDRAPRVPEDTAALPLILRARGFLRTPACRGEEVSIRTLTGRLLSGRLVEVSPGFEHTFGPPIAELLAVGQELKSLLNKRGKE